MDIMNSKTRLVFNAEEKEVMEETRCILEYLRDTMTKNRYTLIFDNDCENSLTDEDIDNAFYILNFLLELGLTID